MSTNQLPNTLDTHVTDLRIAHFEAAWLNRRGDQPPPRWQDYLPDIDETSNVGQIFLLVQMDIECRVRAGLSALLSERYFEHPRLQRADAQFDEEQQRQLIRWEYQQRWQCGDRARRGDYQSAFPAHAEALSDLKPRCTCPRCRQTFVLEETAPSLSCPVCEDPSLPGAEVERTGVTGEESQQLDLRGYELLERLGGGGMGDVYRASDPALGRDLAVKVMKADFQGHAFAERRFVREARVTGSLQHPGIVPIHNLGRLADGRWHYTMRLVRGRTFADMLREDAGKPEALTKLLTIFEKTCQAVAYAHSKHVIHRDLKPSNVMVGRFGEVQVMDWGLAKVLTVEDDVDSAALAEVETTRIPCEDGETPLELTRTGREMGTPAYMPPEQALGEWDIVDERADVFALGAMLCEILTGRPPYGGDAREALRKAKRGELDEALQRLDKCGADAALVTLCRACLAPRREGRPRDAEQVARPIAAYQAEVQERLRRAELERTSALVQAREERKRRRWMFAALVVLLAGASASLWQALRATRAENRARENEDQALTAADSERQARQLAQNRLGQIAKANEVLASIFRELNPRAEEKGGPSLRLQLSQQLEHAAKQLDEAAIGDELAVARLQANLGRSLTNLGQASLAAELLSKAGTALESTLGRDDSETLACRNNLALAYQFAGRSAEALRLFEQIVQQRESRFGSNHPDTLASRNDLANAYTFAGRTVEAIRLHEQILQQTEATFGTDHPRTLISRNSLALAYWHAGRTNEAIRLQEQTLKQKETRLGIDHPDTLNSRNNLANAYVSAGRIREAIRLHEQTLKQMESKLGPDHPHTLNSRSGLAEAYRSAGRVQEAIRLHEQTLQQREAKFGPDHPVTLTARNNLAAAYQSAGRLTDAIRLYEQLLRQRENQLGPDHPDTLTSRHNLAGTYQSAGRTVEAIRLYEQTLPLREAKLGPDHPNTLLTMASLGIAYRDTGRLLEAISLLETALERGRKRTEGLPASLSRLPASLAQTYERAGQADRAESFRREDLERARRKYGARDPRTALALALLGTNLVKQQRFTEAEPLLREGLEIREEKQPEDWNTFSTRSVLGEAFLGQKKYAEAERLLLQGYQGLQKRQEKIPLPVRTLRLTEALERLVRLYEATGQKEKAADWQQQLQRARARQEKPEP